MEKIKNIVIAALMVFIAIILFRSCSLSSKVTSLEEDSSRMINNMEAMKAELVQYKTKDSMNAASIQILHLTLDERDRLIDEYKKDAIAQAQTVMSVHDTVTIPKIDTVIVHKFEKSFIRYGFEDTFKLKLDQDIFVEANIIDKNNKKYVEFVTDMPGVVFHDQNGYLLCEDTRKYRKRMGAGFGIHAGYGLNASTMTFGPTISVGFGINITPKKWQFGK